MSLKNQILTAWAAATNEHERGLVLEEISAARREIAIEYLWAEPALRRAISEMEMQLEHIMRGKYSIAPLKPRQPGGGGPHHAPLVGLAGCIAMLLAVRAESSDRIHAELRGWCVHENRVLDAIEARRHLAKPTNGMTGYVDPVDPLSVPCTICRAPIGVKCVQPAAPRADAAK